MTHRLATNYAKNYCNRTLIVKVIVENVVICFLGTPCRTQRMTVVEDDELSLSVSGVCDLMTLKPFRTFTANNGNSYCSSVLKSTRSFVIAFAANESCDFLRKTFDVFYKVPATCSTHPPAAGIHQL